MKEITLQIRYEKLYFDDLLYVLHSLQNATKKYYDKNELWFDKDFDKKIRDLLANEKINLPEQDSYKTMLAIKQVISKSVTYEIVEFSKGSLIIKCVLAISQSVLLPLTTHQDLPFQITIGIFTALANLFYTVYENEYDEMLEKLRGRLNKNSRRVGREQRGIEFTIEK